MTDNQPRVSATVAAPPPPNAAPTQCDFGCVNKTTGEKLPSVANVKMFHEGPLVPLCKGHYLAWVSTPES